MVFCKQVKLFFKKLRLTFRKSMKSRSLDGQEHEGGIHQLQISLFVLGLYRPSKTRIFKTTEINITPYTRWFGKGLGKGLMKLGKGLGNIRRLG